MHRTDCQNYLESAARPEEKDRWINVSWAPDPEEKYLTSIAITANDREGLVMDIAAVLNSLKIRMTTLTARDMGGGKASIYITIEVSGKSELALAITKIMSVPSVKEIRRQGA